jgi:glycine cleavage system transcriptional repressor
MTLFAVTVIGQDRPSIIAEATGALAELGGNLEDSTAHALHIRAVYL